MKAELFQIFLIGGIALLIIYLFRIKTLLNERIIYIFLSGLGIFFILNPNSTTLIANFFGIGRGTDLVLYLFVLLGIFHAVDNSSECKKTTQQLTSIIRYEAIQNAVHGPLSLPNGDQPRLKGPSKYSEHPNFFYTGFRHNHKNLRIPQNFRTDPEAEYPNLARSRDPLSLPAEVKEYREKS